MSPNIVGFIYHPFIMCAFVCLRERFFWVPAHDMMCVVCKELQHYI